MTRQRVKIAEGALVADDDSRVFSDGVKGIARAPPCAITMLELTPPVPRLSSPDFPALTCARTTPVNG